MSAVCLALVTYNQADLLRRFLDAYFTEGGAGHVRLLVIDDGSDDLTPSILSSLPGDAGIVVHTLPHVSIAHARNHALRNSPTPWLAFSDTDCRLDRRYFETLPGIPARFPGAAAVEGAVQMPGPKPPFTHSLANPKGGSFVTANMVFHAASVLSLGGFDEAFANYREDTDLALTLIEKVGTIPFCADLSVVHPHLPRALGRSLRNAFSVQGRIIASEIRLFEKHPHGYRRVRAHTHARGTLLAWCFRYSARFLKQSLGYLFDTPGLTPRDRIRGLSPAVKEVSVALWEQMCIGIICMVKWRKITRLNTR